MGVFMNITKIEHKDNLAIVFCHSLSEAHEEFLSKYKNFKFFYRYLDRSGAYVLVYKNMGE